MLASSLSPKTGCTFVLAAPHSCTIDPYSLVRETCSILNRDAVHRIFIGPVS